MIGVTSDDQTLQTDEQLRRAIALWFMKNVQYKLCVSICKLF